MRIDARQIGTSAELPTLEAFAAAEGLEDFSKAEQVDAYAGRNGGGRCDVSVPLQPDGAAIAIPSDPVNTGRALLPLDSLGLIKLEPGVGHNASPVDIVANRKSCGWWPSRVRSLHGPSTT
jgi:hypothetical protein